MRALRQLHSAVWKRLHMAPGETRSSLSAHVAASLELKLLQVKPSSRCGRCRSTISTEKRGGASAASAAAPPPKLVLSAGLGSNDCTVLPTIQTLDTCAWNRRDEGGQRRHCVAGPQCGGGGAGATGAPHAALWRAVRLPGPVGCAPPLPASSLAAVPNTDALSQMTGISTDWHGCTSC